jgi:hypothetical protein
VEMLFRTFVLAALLACAQAAQAQALWQGLTTGMTEEEARRVMPAAQPVKVPTTKMMTGAQSKLQVPGQEFQGKTFEATLFFLGDRLSDVQLLHVAAVDAAQGRAAYNELLLALRAKYGQEQRTANQRTVSEAAWAADGMVVTLLGYYEAGSTVINLTFSGRPGR